MRASTQESSTLALLPIKEFGRERVTGLNGAPGAGFQVDPKIGVKGLSLSRSKKFVKEVLQEIAHLDGSFLSTMRYRSAIKDPPGRKSAVLEDPE
jgi:hypothetical protein